jgi:transposase
MSSRTPYCHMVFENTRAKKDAVKLDIIRYAQRLGNKAAARRFGCSKNTVKLWRYRYETQGMSGLKDRCEGPNNIPLNNRKRIFRY